MTSYIRVVFLAQISAFLLASSVAGADPQQSKTKNGQAGQIPTHLLAQFGLSGSTQVSDEQGMAIRGKGRTRKQRRQNRANIRKKNVKKNQVTMHKLKKGSYVGKYKIQVKRGGRTIGATSAHGARF